MKTRLGSFVALLVLAALSLLIAGCSTTSQREAKFEASAKSYQSQQRFGEAIIQYRNAIAAQPSSAALEYELGEAYTSNQQFQDAFAAFSKALQIQPDYEPAQLAVGEFYLVGRQYAKAAASAQALLAAHPGDASGGILLANIDAAQGRSDQARQRLEQVVAAHSANVPAHLSLGILYAVAKRNDDAGRQFQTAIQLDPHSPLARNDLANLLRSEGNPAGAEKIYRADIQDNPQSVPAYQALAQFLAAEHRYAEAEPLYRQLVTLQHNAPQAQFALASFYLSQGKSGAAEAIDRDLARQAPEFVQAREQWAQIAAQNKDYAQMDQVLDALLKDQPNDQAALLLRADVQLDRHQPAAALTTLAAAQRLNPNVARVAYEEGQAYRQQNNLDRAQDSYLQAVSLNPNFYAAEGALAELLMERGHSDAALGYAKKMQTLAPQDAQGYFIAGNALANLRQLPQAEQAFEQYAALAPQSSLGPNRLGYVSLMEKHLPAAQSDFERALELNPGDSNALAGLALLYQEQGQSAKIAPRIQAQLARAAGAHAAPAALATMNDQLARVYAQQNQPAEAVATLNKALTQDPRNFNTYVLLGTIYAQQKSFPQAREQLTKAVNTDPNNAGLWTMLGMLDEQMQLPDPAQQAYTRALALDPDNGVANNNLAAIYARQPQNLDRALALAQRAKRALPNVANVSDTLGWIYANQNVYQMAIPLLEQAVKAEPDSTDFRVHLGTALYRDGRKPEAQAELNQAIRLDKGVAEQPSIAEMLKH